MPLQLNDSLNFSLDTKVKWQEEVTNIKLTTMTIRELQMPVDNVTRDNTI